MKNVGTHFTLGKSASNTILKLSCSGAIVFGFSTFGWSSENGVPNTPPGIFDFGSGITPPPTEIGALGVRIVDIRSDKIKDNQGNDSAVEPDLNFNAIIFAGLRMTNKEFLGARYGYGLVVPLTFSSLDLSIPTPYGEKELKGSKNGLGDVQIIPMVLQWRPKPNLWIKSDFMIQVPTGDYDKGRTINPGVNHWTFQPSVNMTYISESGIEVSTSTQLNFNTKNEDTNYRSGTDLQQDFSVGKHIGHWTFGVGGYYLKQLTDDNAPNLTHGNRAEAKALGPAIGYVNHKSPIQTVFLHAYKEFDVKNRTEGSNIAIRLGKTF